MEEAFRAEWMTSASEPRPRTFCTPLEDDVPNRIRSLLLARNERLPPRTPCPTPDYLYLSRHPEYLPIGNQIAPQRARHISSKTVTTKLNRFALSQEQMGATRYDGPAGQVHDESLKRLQRNPSHPMNTKSATDDSDQSLDHDRKNSRSGLGFKVTKPLVGQPFAGRGGFQKSTAIPKRAENPSSPKITYTLRTLPPKSAELPDSRPHLGNQHVPGSYRSEREQSAEPPNSQTLAAPLMLDYVLKQHHHTPSVKAVEALHKIKDHLEHPVTPGSSVRGKVIAGVHTDSSFTSHSELTSKDPESHTQPTSDDHPVRSKLYETQASGNPAIIDAPTVESTQTGNVYSDSKSEHRFSSLSHLPPLPSSPTTASAASNKTDDKVEASQHLRTTSWKNQSPVFQSETVATESLAKVAPGSAEVVGHEPSAEENVVRLPLWFHQNAEVYTPGQKTSSTSERKENDVQSSATSITSRIKNTERWVQQVFGQHKADQSAESSLSPTPMTRKASAILSEQRSEHIDHHHSVDPESTDESAFLEKQQRQSHSINTAITELESLLKQALVIADHAVDTETKAIDHNSSSKSHNGKLSKNQTRSPSSPSIRIADAGNPHEEGEQHRTNPQQAAFSLVNIKSSQGSARDPIPEMHDSNASIHSPVPTRPQSDEGIEISREDPKIEKSQHLLPALNDTNRSHDLHENVTAMDWANVQKPAFTPSPVHDARSLPQVQSEGRQQSRLNNDLRPSWIRRSDQHVRQGPQIQPRASSLRQRHHRSPYDTSTDGSAETSGPYVADFHNSALQYHPIVREVMNSTRTRGRGLNNDPSQHAESNLITLKEIEAEPLQGHSHPTQDDIRKGYSLKDRHHFSIREPHGFSLSRSHRRAPISRDWNTPRKRFVAVVTCVNTAFLGLIIGVYAGEVPAIQYTIADEHHYTILGNVVFFMGLAITTIWFWPLPLLHGRKPYTLGSLIFLMLLQFPQALVVASPRTPYVATYRVGILVPRALAGLVAGFAYINFMTTLLDLFGSSLQSGNPHQEIVNENDVRRHGGGMGVWLGIWTWSSIGSIGVGFWIGASIISALSVAWGFWITIILNAFVLLLNVITPEVRRSPYRRSMAEVRSGTDVSRRIARGEVKMHLDSTGPVWWWEEVFAGVRLSILMLKQPGFACLALYLGWIYGQVVILIVVSPIAPNLRGTRLTNLHSFSGLYSPSITTFILSSWDFLSPSSR